MRRRLLDSRSYIDLRLRYRFGSAADPASGNYYLAEDEYVPTPLSESMANAVFDIKGLADALEDGECLFLLGQFGAGKSITVRETFKELRKRHLQDRAKPVPVAINLRDHWGQFTVDEALRRHANRIGFEKPDQLVRAWNAGQLMVLLDGFDELASPAWQAKSIRDSRKEALRLVKAFLADSKGRNGILVAGRDNYFDSLAEAKALLSPPPDTHFIYLGEFTEDQATSYLKKKGVSKPLPYWLPRKPLLLGYLATRNLLDSVLGISGETGTAYAWDQFINRICEREAQLNQDIDAESVRRILEELAARTRESTSGNGPLYEADLSEAYKKVTGFEPLEAAKVLLQRLPGLTARDQELGARSFVDVEYLQMLRAGQVARFILNPYVFTSTRKWQQALNELGHSAVAMFMERDGVRVGQFAVAAQVANEKWQEPTLALDCLISGARSTEVDTFDCINLTIREGIADIIDLVEYPMEHLTMQSCLINVVRLEAATKVGPVLRDCMVAKVEGVPDGMRLPPSFVECVVDSYDIANTNAAIIDSTLPAATKVLCTVIRKLFLQSGAGRLETALYRGLPQGAIMYVGPILDILASEQIIYCHTGQAGRIWHSARVHRSRMLSILQAPIQSKDGILEKVRRLR